MATDQRKSPPWDLDITKLMSELKLPGVDLETFVATQRKNLEAVAQANKLAFEGMQAVAKRQTEVVRQTLEEMSSIVSELMAPSSPEQKVAKQAELAKVAFEKALANMKELAEMLAKSNSEAADVINKRISESLDEIKLIASKAPGKSA